MGMSCPSWETGTSSSLWLPSLRLLGAALDSCSSLRAASAGVRIWTVDSNGDRDLRRRTIPRQG